MKAMVLERTMPLNGNDRPLVMRELPIPQPKEYEVLIKVAACGVCHTELDEIEGRTPPAYFPMVLGHQAVGVIESCGENVQQVHEGDVVGVAWIYSACGQCEYCQSGHENLCAEFKATGRDAPGGYAEYMLAHENFVYPIPPKSTPEQAAPLLCAGAIGYRSLRLAALQDGQRLGLSGFGASAHLVLKLARYLYPHSQVYVFTRSPSEGEFALELGAAWAGDFDTPAPEQLHSIIDTTPVWKPILASLSNLAPGGRLVINAIRKESSDQHLLSELDYPIHLWMEKEIKSVANVTRRDVREFLQIAAEIPIIPEVQLYSLEEANQALQELRERKIRGAKVLKIM